MVGAHGLAGFACIAVVDFGQQGMELWPHHAFGCKTQGREPAAMVTESVALIIAGVRVVLMHLGTNAQAFVGTISPGHSVSSGSLCVPCPGLCREALLASCNQLLLSRCSTDLGLRCLLWSVWCNALLRLGVLS